MSGQIHTFSMSGPERAAPPVPGGRLCGMYPEAWRHGHLVPHAGIDLCAPKGTPIVVPLAGTVTRKTTTTHGGNNFTVRHDGFVTYYAHADDVLVGVGQQVRTHEVVATVGQSGVTSSGAAIDPHLHFQVMQSEEFSSEHYDPEDFLDSLGIVREHRVFYWKDGFPVSDQHSWLAIAVPWLAGIGVVGLLVWRLFR